MGKLTHRTIPNKFGSSLVFQETLPMSERIVKRALSRMIPVKTLVN